MLRYLSAEIVSSEKHKVFHDGGLRTTVHFEEQIMFKDKEHINGLSFNTPSFDHWGISLRYSPVSVEHIKLQNT